MVLYRHINISKNVCHLTTKTSLFSVRPDSRWLLFVCARTCARSVCRLVLKPQQFDPSSVILLWNISSEDIQRKKEEQRRMDLFLDCIQHQHRVLFCVYDSTSSDGGHKGNTMWSETGIELLKEKHFTLKTAGLLKHQGALVRQERPVGVTYRRHTHR